MTRFHSAGWILSLGLLASSPLGAQGSQAWVLALDDRGGVVGDLKAGDLQVKVGGRSVPVARVETPAQVAQAPQSWVLVFEPIRDVNLRAVAFRAAADFLAKVPEGDRVMIVARGKDSLESLMPGLTPRRATWAAALAKVPEMLPEGLTGSCRETLQGAGFQPGFAEPSDGEAGQGVLLALLAQFQAGNPGWARGTVDQRGVGVLERLNFNNPTFVTGMLAAIAKETRALESIFDALSAVSGQKHLVVFSRCESDEMCHPTVKRAMTQRFQRERGDLGGPAESATLATRDMNILQQNLKAKASATGVTVYSVAGPGQNVVGHVGSIAPATGGHAFPLRDGIDAQFGQGIQVFGSRHLVVWAPEPGPSTRADLDILTTRKGIRLIFRSIL